MLILKETKDGITTLLLEACTETIKFFFSLIHFWKMTNLLHYDIKLEPKQASRICRSHSLVDKDFSLWGYNTTSNGSYERFKGVQCPLHQVGD